MAGRTVVVVVAGAVVEVVVEVADDGTGKVTPRPEQVPLARSQVMAAEFGGYR